MDWKGKYETFKEVGCYMGEKKDTDFYHYTFSYILQVYNRSDIPKIMRNFKIRFLRNGKEVFSMTPDDNSTRKFVNSGYYIDKIEVINVNPKEIQVLKQSGYISYEELKYIENASKVELIYYNEKDKKRTIVLHKDIISTNNYISKS